MNNANVAVVLGAGRSGTSLAMQVLAENGMGVTGLREDVDTSNLRGDFEDQTITGIQQDILDTLGMSPNQPREITRPEVRKISAQLEKLKTYVAQNVAACPTVWGFKDPRSSNMLPLWQIVFRELGLTPRWILCVRHPAAVVTSMKTHFNRPEQVSELVWLTRNCDSLVHTGGDTFVVHYEDWFRGREVAATLAKKLLAHVSLSGDRVEASIDKLVSPSLNRSVPAYVPANPLVAHIYETLRQMPSGEPVPDAVVRMARSIKNTTEFYLAPVFTGGSNARTDKAKQQADEKVRQLEGQLAQMQEDALQARRENVDLQEKSEQARLSSLELEQQSQHAHSANLELKAELKEAQRKLALLLEEGEQARREKVELQEQCRKFEEEGARWKASAAELRSVSENLDKELRSLGQAATAAAESHSVALGALAANRDELRAERDRMLAELQQQELQNNAYLREIKALHDKVREFSIRLHASAPDQPPTGGERAARALVPPSPVSRRGLEKKQARVAPLTKDAKNVAEIKPAKVAVPRPKATRSKPVLTRRARLWRKFRQDPYRYFADSRIAAIRPLRHLF